jgi:hypothetical protein
MNVSAASLVPVRPRPVRASSVMLRNASGKK